MRHPASPRWRIVMRTLTARIPALLRPIQADGRVTYYEDPGVDDGFDDVGFYVAPFGVGVDTVEPMLRMPRLQVVQLVVAGYEHALPFVPQGVHLCNAPGVHDTSTAELAVGLIIAAQRGLDRAERDAATGRWAHGFRAGLADRSVLVIGAGGVARAIQRRLLAFEAHVTLVGQAARPGVHSVTQLPHLLPDADIVVLAVPLTDTTRGMVDRAFVSQMRTGALLVNMSRGPVVVTSDLVGALHDQRIRAALDVTDPEPLPEDHPLWACPDVIITPHLGGHTSAWPPRIRPLIERQLLHWSRGEPLSHVVAGGLSRGRA